MRSQALALICLLASACQISVLAAPFQQHSALVGRQLAGSPLLHKKHALVNGKRSIKRSSTTNATTVYPRQELVLAQISREPEESRNMPFMTRADIKTSSSNSNTKRSVKNNKRSAFDTPRSYASKGHSNPKLALHKRASSDDDEECDTLTKKSSSSSGMAGSYYPDWNGDNFPPEKVDYSRFDLLYFAFGIPDENFDIYFTQSDSVNLLKRLVKNAHKHSTKVVLSIGGWTGSQHFSDAVSSSSNRETFASNIATIVTKYNLDGIDLDWEYPGSAGATNDYASADSANLALLLKQIRKKLGSKKLITMAVSVQPFTGPNGYPLSDVSAQAKYLDHILIMNYDVWGASDNPGANAPLSNACGDSQQPAASARAAIAAWKAANMPASKIVLGLPAYGYVSWSGATSLVHKRDQSSAPAAAPRTYMEYWQAGRIEGEARRLAKKSGLVNNNNSTDAVAAAAPSGLLAADIKAFEDDSSAQTHQLQARSGDGDLSAYAQSQIPFDTLVSLGALKRKSDGSFVAANGFTRKWDDCSNTPYLYSRDKWQVVTYDDPTSIQLKARYARGQKIGGFAFWDMSSDVNYRLMDAARRGFGLS